MKREICSYLDFYWLVVTFKGLEDLKEKQKMKKDGITYHKLQFSLYVCPVKNLCPFLSQVPEDTKT